MNVKELIIGDYIVSELGNIYRVKGVRDLDGGEVLVSTGKADMWYEYKLIRPITITEEVLKANAFEVCYESCYQAKFNIWSFDEKTCVEYKISKQTEDYNHLKIFIDGCERVRIHIRYVHELQNALRLCGLNDLADNFKVGGEE